MRWTRRHWCFVGVLSSALVSACGDSDASSLDGVTAMGSGAAEDGGDGDGNSDGDGPPCAVDDDCAGDLICDPLTNTCMPALSDPCGAQTPIEVNGNATGFFRCEDGSIRRSEAVACAAPSPESLPVCTGDEEMIACQSDADCTEFPNLEGHCAREATSGGTLGDDVIYTCGCVYTCSADAACGDGEVCHCPTLETSLPARELYPTCVAADCATDDDCASGECGFAATSPYEGADVVYLSYACRTPDDECRGIDDCDISAGSTCAATSGMWACN